MTVKELQNLSMDEFKQLSASEQRQAVTTLASAYNKRIKRVMAKGGEHAPALESSNVDFTTKGYFTAKGKKKSSELAEEFKREKTFGELKTSTVSGYEKYMQTVGQIQDREHGGELSRSLASDAWAAFRKMKEDKKGITDGSYASDQLFTYMKDEIIGNRKYNTFGEGDIERRLEERINDAYEKGEWGLREADPTQPFL